MSATARLIVMMDPEDERELVAGAKAQKVSVAKLARQRLTGRTGPEERIFLQAVVEPGEKAQRIFGEADARAAREAAAHARQLAREAVICAEVEAVFAGTRAGTEASERERAVPKAGVAT